MQVRSLSAIPLLIGAFRNRRPCAQPYAIVETGAAAEARNEGRVSIRKIDGRSTSDPRPGPLLSWESERFRCLLTRRPPAIASLYEPSRPPVVK